MQIRLLGGVIWRLLLRRTDACKLTMTVKDTIITKDFYSFPFSVLSVPAEVTKWTFGACD